MLDGLVCVCVCACLSDSEFRRSLLCRGLRRQGFHKTLPPIRVKPAIKSREIKRTAMHLEALYMTSRRRCIAHLKV